MAKGVLLVYDPPGGAWTGRLGQVCALQGLRLRRVEQGELSLSLAALAEGRGAPEGSPALPPLPEPVLVLCGLSGTQLDRLLAGLRQAGVPREVLKAVLTPSNGGWTLPRLYLELSRERAALS